MSKYGVFSGPYFPVFGLNTRKYGAEKTPYLDTFHAVNPWKKTCKKSPTGAAINLKRCHQKDFVQLSIENEKDMIENFAKK